MLPVKNRRTLSSLLTWIHMAPPLFDGLSVGKLQMFKSKSFFGGVMCHRKCSPDFTSHHYVTTVTRYMAHIHFQGVNEGWSNHGPLSTTKNTANLECVLHGEARLLGSSRRNFGLDIMGVVQNSATPSEVPWFGYIPPPKEWFFKW